MATSCRLSILQWDQHGPCSCIWWWLHHFWWICENQRLLHRNQSDRQGHTRLKVCLLRWTFDSSFSHWKFHTPKPTFGADLTVDLEKAQFKDSEWTKLGEMREEKRGHGVIIRDNVFWIIGGTAKASVKQDTTAETCQFNADQLVCQSSVDLVLRQGCEAYHMGCMLLKVGLA